MDFKNIIVDLRKERGITQTELAEMLNLGKSTVAMWETGKRMPSRIVLEQIGDLFNVDMDYLCGKQKEKRKTTFSQDGTAYKVITPDALFVDGKNIIIELEQGKQIVIEQAKATQTARLLSYLNKLTDKQTLAVETLVKSLVGNDE